MEMSKKLKKAHDKVQNQVDLLNEKFEVHEVISLEKDDGSYVNDTIVNEFTIMCGNAVGWLRDHGSYMAERVHKLK